MTKKLNKAEKSALAGLLDQAVAEEGRDLTSEALIPEQAEGRGRIVSKSRCVLAGLPVAREICDRFALSFQSEQAEGSVLQPGSTVGTVQGGLRDLLRCERILLNFLSRLCGIASLTRQYVEAFHPVAVFDTRKTTPGWRLLEKYAVRVGGGCNHRMGLGDLVLIKDNHLVALELLEGQKRGTSRASVVGRAVRQARRFLEAELQAGRLKQPCAIEVEVETRDELREAAAAGADIIMLDNWDLSDVRKALSELAGEGKKFGVIELSGGITLQNAPEVATAGVDRIAVGALTHSAPAADLSLELEKAWVQGGP